MILVDVVCSLNALFTWGYCQIPKKSDILFLFSSPKAFTVNGLLSALTKRPINIRPNSQPSLTPILNRWFIENEKAWHKVSFVVISVVIDILTKDQTSIQEVTQWKKTSKCIYPAPNRWFLPVGSLKPLLYKAKPIVRWGRKATGLNIPRWASFKVYCCWKIAGLPSVTS